MAKDKLGVWRDSMWGPLTAIGRLQTLNGRAFPNRCHPRPGMHPWSGKGEFHAKQHPPTDGLEALGQTLMQQQVIMNPRARMSSTQVCVASHCNRLVHPDRVRATCRGSSNRQGSSAWQTLLVAGHLSPMHQPMIDACRRDRSIHPQHPCTPIIRR